MTSFASTGMATGLLITAAAPRPQRSPNFCRIPFSQVPAWTVMNHVAAHTFF